MIQHIGYAARVTPYRDGRRVPKLWVLATFWETEADHAAGKPAVLVEDFMLPHTRGQDVVAEVRRLVARHGVVAMATGRRGHPYDMAHRATVPFDPRNLPVEDQPDELPPLFDPEETLKRPEVAALKGQTVTEVDAATGSGVV